MTQQVGREQHGLINNGPIYLYRLSFLSGRAQQTFSRAYAMLGPAVDMPLLLNNHPSLVYVTRSVKIDQVGTFKYLRNTNLKYLMSHNFPVPDSSHVANFYTRSTARQ